MMYNNNYSFFDNEFQKYKKALLDYKSNSQIFIDENFHPQNKIIEDEFNLYEPSIEWKRIDQIYPAPLFKKELIHHEYILQGMIGDCYFISALMRIAKQPYLVEPLFEKELPDTILGEVKDSINIKCGAVVVYFRAFGRITPVLIDTLIPTIYGFPIFNRLINNSKSPWSLLVEKAYAKLNGSYTNIVGGYFFESIYSLYGYYNERIFFIDKTTLNKNSLILQILQHHHNGCIMDSAIISNTVAEDELQKHNLLDRHSYLLLKMKKYKDSYFFLLFNPHGRTIWKGDYSSDSKLWTPELKELLKNEPERGRFWMIDDDFFHYFNEIDVSKPINPHWTVRLIQCKLNDIMTKFEKMQNFVFKITEKIPKNQKFQFHLLIEKRATDYSKYATDTKLNLCYAHTNGNKIDEYTQMEIVERYTRIQTVSIDCTGKDDIVTFILYKVDNFPIEEICYVRAFCQYDFDLYEADKPGILFPKCENLGAAFDNFTITNPTAALPLKKTIVNHKNAFWFSNNYNKDELVSNIVIDAVKNMDSKHYSNLGPQVNLDMYIFNNNKIMVRPKYICYLVDDKKEGKEYAAYISRLPISAFLKDFSEQLLIQRNLKYPSIISFYGYCERDFTHKPSPVLLLEHCKRGSLSNVLSMQNDGVLQKKGFGDWNNTKKMINLIGISLGMKYIHDHNIILRNLMCCNIFLDDNLYPKISEFYLAKMSSSELDCVGMNGPDYCIAPEYICADEPYSFPIDVFAYGMLFFHVISNKEPQIPHVNIGQLYMSIYDGELPKLDPIPEKYHQFISSLWNKDPKLRPTFDKIIELLLDDKRQLWLDDVDEKEVEQYLHQFARTLKHQKKKLSLKELIDQIDENNFKTIPYQEMIKNPIFSNRLINDIKHADQIILNKEEHNDNNDQLLYKVGIEISSKLLKNCSNSLKYLKASAYCGNENAISFILKNFYIDTSDENLIRLGVKLVKDAVELDLTCAFLLIAELYMTGKGVKKNFVMAAIYYKILANKNNVKGMHHYANILMDAFRNKKEHNYLELIKEANQIVATNDSMNMIFYTEARRVFDTIENDQAILFMAKKYYKNAAQKGDDDSDFLLQSILKNYPIDDYNYPQYFDELA